MAGGTRTAAAHDRRGGWWAVVALATLLVAFAGCTERGDAASIHVANRTGQAAEIRLVVSRVESAVQQRITYSEVFNQTFTVQSGANATAETRLRTGHYTAVASSGQARNETTFSLKRINWDELRSIEVVLEDGALALFVHGSQWAITRSSTPSPS